MPLTVRRVWLTMIGSRVLVSFENAMPQKLVVICQSPPVAQMSYQADIFQLCEVITDLTLRFSKVVRKGLLRREALSIASGVSH